MKPEQMYEFAKSGARRKRLTLGMKAGAALGIGFTALFLALLAVQYFYNLYYRFPSIDPAEAEKIGNWQLPDKDYIVTDLGQIAVDNQNIAMAGVLDKKSGNKFMFFKTAFLAEEILRTKDARLDKILGNYNLGGYYFISAAKIQKYGEEINYDIVGWGADRNVKKGIVASIDCRTKTDSINTVFVAAVNSLAKYDNDRAVEFIKTLKCGGADKGISQDDERNWDKLDSDKDGLPDKVEIMLGTDPYKASTKGDSYADFESIRDGYNPLSDLPRPYNKYTPEEFAKVKKDIKYISPETYNKLWGGN